MVYEVNLQQKNTSQPPFPAFSYILSHCFRPYTRYTAAMTSFDTHTLLLLLALLHMVALAVACHALLRKRDPRSALGWAAVCVLAPLIGPLLYILFGIARTDSRAVRLMKKAARSLVRMDPHVWLGSRPRGCVEHNRLPVRVQRLAVPGKNLTGRAVAGGNLVRSLHNGEAAYPRMLEAINAATRRVYLSTFIFGRDAVGERFVNALCEAARRGCDVRLLVDGVGSWPLSLPTFFDAPLIPRLREAGVQVARFLPPTLFPPQLSINLRTHRKLLVCDGQVGFTGGMNIAANHLAQTSRPDRVQDLHFRFEGPVVAELQAAFLLDWSFVTNTPGLSPLDAPPPVPGSTFCRMLMDGPGSIHDTIHDLFCAMIAQAERSVRIVSPYFLPTHELAGALSAAVLRGVRVEVILPGLNNHRLVDWAMRHQLPDLVQKGVDIRFQPPPFAHTKLMLVDGVYTLLGSANLDPRSLRLNFELVMEVFDPALTGELTAFFHHLRNRSAPLSPSRAAPLPVRLRNAAAWIFSPYL